MSEVIDKDKEKEQNLPDLRDGERGTVVSVTLVAKETKKPVRYTEAALLSDMEGASKFVEDADLRKVLKTVLGLGTAATRHAVIETLKSHKYIEKAGKSLAPTAKGLAFIQWLDKVCPELTDIGMTARWEAELGVVALKGGGKDFQERVEDNIRRLVTIFKALPSMADAGFRLNTPESSSMTEEKRVNKPTDKMLEFAKNIASRLNIAVPDEALNDWDTCKQFIDDNKDNASRPTDKQLNFAKQIAERRGVTIPADVEKNGRELSKWIDANIK